MLKVPNIRLKQTAADEVIRMGNSDQGDRQISVKLAAQLILQSN